MGHKVDAVGCLFVCCTRLHHLAGTSTTRLRHGIHEHDMLADAASALQCHMAKLLKLPSTQHCFRAGARLRPRLTSHLKASASASRPRSPGVPRAACWPWLSTSWWQPVPACGWTPCTSSLLDGQSRSLRSMTMTTRPRLIIHMHMVFRSTRAPHFC